MKEITKQEFTSMIMQLILFSERLRKILPSCEMITIEKAIETIRYWSQFAPKEKGDR